jgi:hypothetical protein
MERKFHYLVTFVLNEYLPASTFGVAPPYGSLMVAELPPGTVQSSVNSPFSMRHATSILP